MNTGEEKFVVSARKYRPQLFDTVIGQPHITTTLKNAITKNQLAHAYLFCGPRGVGKTTCARILAKTINCNNQTAEGEACNECESCLSFNSGQSFNVHELDAASNNSVDDIRVLVDQVRFAPQAGKYKVYVIDEVHMLSSQAFNAFLKTLEEPPSYVIFILATTEKHKILPTILSRCQIFDFRRITTADTVEHLQEICDKEDVGAEKAALQLIAQKSEGCMRDALSLMDKIVSFTGSQLTYTNTLEHLNILDADYFFKLLGCMLQQDVSAALLLHDEINRLGFESEVVLSGLSEFFRNLLVCKDVKAAVLLEAVDAHRDKYTSTASGTATGFIINALTILNEAEIQLRSSRNKKLHAEITLIKLCYLNQTLELATDNSGLTKKKITDTAQAVSFKNIPAFVPVKEKNKQAVDQKKNNNPAQPIPETINISTPKNKTTAPGNPAHQPARETNQQSKIGPLQKIREQFKATTGANGGNMVTPVNQQALHTAWEEFTVTLKEKNNPALQSFLNVQLTCIDENSFEVQCRSIIEQRFVEQERAVLHPFLQKKLNNRLLRYTITYDENAELPDTGPLPLTQREQLEQMEQLYPAVGQLRKSLNLNLDL